MRLSSIIKYLSPSNLHHLVHQLDQVRLLVGLLVSLSEVLDRVVDEVFQALG